jgi:fucose permease
MVQIFYKKIAIIYVVLIGFIFFLSFIWAPPNKMRVNEIRVTQLDLSRDSFLVVMMVLIVLVIIFIVFKFSAKKKISPQEQKSDSNLKNPINPYN